MILRPALVIRVLRKILLLQKSKQTNIHLFLDLTYEHIITPPHPS